MLHKTDDKVLEWLESTLEEKYPEIMETIQNGINEIVTAAWIIVVLIAIACAVSIIGTIMRTIRRW